MSRPEVGNREGENVRCPLFIAFTENEIRCFPHVPEASATVNKYNDRNMCYKQRKLFCEGEWERCEHYQTWKHFMWEDDD